MSGRLVSTILLTLGLTGAPARADYFQQGIIAAAAAATGLTAVELCLARLEAKKNLVEHGRRPKPETWVRLGEALELKVAEAGHRNFKLRSMPLENASAEATRLLRAKSSASPIGRLRGEGWPLKVEPVDGVAGGRFRTELALALYADFANSTGDSLIGALFLGFHSIDPLKGEGYPIIKWFGLTASRQAIALAQEELRARRFPRAITFKTRTFVDTDVDADGRLMGSDESTIVTVEGAVDENDYLRANFILLQAFAQVAREANVPGYESPSARILDNRRAQDYERYRYEDR